MSRKYLGLDMGTNSIGWAIRDASLGEDENQIIARGSHIFSRGVGKSDKGEYSFAKERTLRRSARKLYRRRKVRKAQLLKILIAENMCPMLQSELDSWVKYDKTRAKHYPVDNVHLQEWFKICPYKARKNASEGKVTPMEFGRALYHYAQRRGFKSSRKDQSDPNAVPKDIVVKNQFKKEHGDVYLIEQQYKTLENGGKIRLTRDKDDETVNTSRLLYAEEFEAICAKQGIEVELKDRLYDAIFFQRGPKQLKKSMVGKCTMEPAKFRAKMSTIEFEEYRMLAFINNIRYKPSNEPLTAEHRAAIMPLFYKSHRSTFSFEEISKCLNKNSKKDGIAYSFNFTNDDDAPGCPTIWAMYEFFGDEWRTIHIDAGTDRQNKPIRYTALDIWHIWDSFDDYDRLVDLAINRLEFSTEKAEKFAKVRMTEGYAKLSIAAIRKILPWLREGIQLAPAIFLANVPIIMGAHWKEHQAAVTEGIRQIYDDHINQKRIIDTVNGLIEEHRDAAHPKYTMDNDASSNLLNKLKNTWGRAKWEASTESQQQQWIERTEAIFLRQMRMGVRANFIQKTTVDAAIKDFLKEEFGLTNTDTDRLYHPSEIEVYPKAVADPHNENRIVMPSPLTDSIRNPMAMRALHELRKLMQDLIDRDMIDTDTVIIVELFRDLNDSNRRAAISTWQKRQRTRRETAKEKIEAAFKADNKVHIVSDDDIERYLLWQEQNSMCLYTKKGENMSVADVLSGNKFQLEHTLPRSKSFDNSLANKTLTDEAFNAKKGTKTPAELYELGIIKWEDIEPRIEHWKEQIVKLEKDVKKYRKARGYEDKKTKDDRIKRKHLAQIELDYWRSKYNRFKPDFVMTKGFVNSQKTDTAIISKYARLYLKAAFEEVYAVKGSITAEFRKIWGIQGKDEVKNRTMHTHHAMDAAVLTCMTPGVYKCLANYYKKEEENRHSKEVTTFKELTKPWRTLTQDIRQIGEEAIVTHAFRDTTLKQTTRTVNGDRKSMGAGVRGALHQDTFYGQIEQDGKKSWVLRVSLDKLKQEQVARIVDPHVRAAIERVGLKAAQEAKPFKAILNPDKARKNNKLPQETIIKKVRVYQSNVISPRPVAEKQQSHQSTRPSNEYKRHYYAQNAENYMLVIYRQGKEHACEIINLLQVADYIRNPSHAGHYPLYPESIQSKKDTILPIYKVLQKERMVLLRGAADEIVNWDDSAELSKRLYKVLGFSFITTYGAIALIHHKEGNSTSDLTSVNKPFSISDTQQPPYRMLYHTQFWGLVEGVDFTMSPSGRIEPIDKNTNI
jgi:CRISPR-associated endonuclease Csn1